MGKLIVDKKEINEVDIIFSKSYVHRVMIMDYIVDGTINKKFSKLSNDIDETTFVISSLLDNKNEFEIKESGSTLRMLLPIILSKYEKSIIKCSKSLINRPLDSYNELFKLNNIKLQKRNNKLLFTGKINKVIDEIDCSISSQYVSGLIFLILFLNIDMKIKVNNITSKNYILLTIDICKKYGAKIEFDDNYITIKKSNLQKPKKIIVEGDFSNAAFFIAHSLLNKQTVIINNLNKDSLQADKKIIKILDNNIKFSYTNNSLICEYKNNNPIDCDIDSCPDLGPILIATSMFLDGKSTIRNTKRLKYKESDRLKVSLEILDSFNIKYELIDDDLIIYGGNYSLCKNEFDSYNDHRIVMTLAIISLCINEDIILSNYEAVNKSYPNFFDIISHQKF